MRKILFVIDYQNDFVDGALGFEGAELLDKKIAEKIFEYGEGNVFFTRDTHTENYLETREGKHLPVVHCIKNTHGWEIYGETGRALKQVSATGFDKASFGLDTENETNGLLPENVSEIELVGLVSNICVISCAVTLQTRYPDAQISVDAECIDSFDKNLNDAVLKVFEGLQINVKNK